MATGVKTYEVDIASNPSVIKVTANPTATNVAEAFPVANISQVTPIFYDYTLAEAATKDTQQATYPYPTKTVLILETIDGKKLSLELQSITNQAAWSLGTQAALQAAAAAINALL
jgi:hypothetical protein